MRLAISPALLILLAGFGAGGGGSNGDGCNSVGAPVATGEGAGLRANRRSNHELSGACPAAFMRLVSMGRVGRIALPQASCIRRNWAYRRSRYYNGVPRKASVAGRAYQYG